MALFISDGREIDTSRYASCSVGGAGAIGAGLLTSVPAFAKRAHGAVSQRETSQSSGSWKHLPDPAEPSRVPLLRLNGILFWYTFKLVYCWIERKSRLKMWLWRIMCRFTNETCSISKCHIVGKISRSSFRSYYFILLCCLVSWYTIYNKRRENILWNTQNKIPKG